MTHNDSHIFCILLEIFISNKNKRVFNECLDMCDHSNMITLLCFDICIVKFPFLFPLKGERVLGENIADNGGLKTAYAAYKQWERSQGSAEVKNLPGLSLTQEQLFFVGFGQVQYSELVLKTKIFESRIK